MSALHDAEIEQVAACFWDGGWRASDAEQFREEYLDIDDEDFERIMKCLEKWEGE